MIFPKKYLATIHQWFCQLWTWLSAPAIMNHFKQWWKLGTCFLLHRDHLLSLSSKHWWAWLKVKILIFFNLNQCQLCNSTTLTFWQQSLLQKVLGSHNLVLCFFYHNNNYKQVRLKILSIENSCLEHALQFCSRSLISWESLILLQNFELTAVLDHQHTKISMLQAEKLCLHSALDALIASSIS